MSSSTSSSEPGASNAAKSPAGSSRTFLAAIAGGVLLGIAGFSLMDESWLHQGPEYGMSEAHQDHMREACARQEAPALLILGDSRAVAGLSVKAIRDAGIDADKFALGASGLFAGWAYLDRLLDCGVRPRNVLLAYGLVHTVDTGAILDRTTNFDAIRGPRAAYEYDELSKAETRLARRATYKAISLFGAELSGVDFTLLAPSLKRVLEAPAYAADNHKWFLRERANFLELSGDRYYGMGQAATELPQERSAVGPIPKMNIDAVQKIAEGSRRYGFRVYFYMMPSTEIALKGLDPAIIEKARGFIADLPKYDITPLNGVWSLPDTYFGDESHVNPKGRSAVTEDFLPRWLPGGYLASAKLVSQSAAPSAPAASR